MKDILNWVRETFEEYRFRACLVALGGLLLYVLSLVVVASFWERRCLAATFLGARISYAYEVYCVTPQKVLRIQIGGIEEPETEEAQ